MDCGLGNLEGLKRHLLAATLAGETQWDAALAGLGRAVAGAFDRATNRRLGWSAAAEVVFTGDRAHYTLPRYPVAAVTEVAAKWAGDWEVLAGEPALVEETSGVVRFRGEFGEGTLVRVKWSGGYWHETLEPDEPEYPGSAPAGAAELPADLRGAWLAQCEVVWSQRDKLGVAVGGKSSGPGLGQVDLAPLVERILRGYVRYQIS